MGSFVVVGFGGTPTSDVPLRWAMTEARLRGAELVIVYAYDWADVGVGIATPGGLADGARALAEAVVAAAVADARSVDPHLRVRGEAVLGRPVDVLAELSRGAALVVVGSGAHPRWAGRPTPLAHRLLRRASCPVLVTAAGSPDEPEPSHGVGRWLARTPAS
jgi:nucleotide-binding universal stress UspA family protein